MSVIVVSHTTSMDPAISAVNNVLETLSRRVEGIGPSVCTARSIVSITTGAGDILRWCFH